MRRGQPSRTHGTAGLAHPTSLRVDHNATDVQLIAVVFLHRPVDEDLCLLHLGPPTVERPELVNIDKIKNWKKKKAHQLQNRFEDQAAALRLIQRDMSHC